MNCFSITTAVVLFYSVANVVAAGGTTGNTSAMSRSTLEQSAQTLNDELFECLIEPYEQVSISSEASGVIEKYFIERGDFVRRGQKLVALQSGIEQAAVELAKAKVDFGERKVQRNKELLAKDLISEQETDELETENRIAALELKEMEEKLNMRTIYSPIRGVVVERHNSAGEYVGSEPVLTIAQIDPLNIEVIVPVEKYGSIKKGMQAEVFPFIPSGIKVKGKVVIVDSVIDAASGTFGVRVKVNNKRHRLAAGVKCQIRFLK